MNPVVGLEAYAEMSEESSAWCNVVKVCLVLRLSADHRGVHVKEVEEKHDYGAKLDCGGRA